jgi:hypothetical protein
MISFQIQTIDDTAYSRIMECIMSSGVTHSKEMIGGTASIEIQGSLDNYHFFKNLISDINSKKSYSVAAINEMF